MLAARVVLSTLPAREAVITVQHQMVIDIGKPVVATVLIPGAASVGAFAPALTSTLVRHLARLKVAQEQLVAVSTQLGPVRQITFGTVVPVSASATAVTSILVRMPVNQDKGKAAAVSTKYVSVVPVIRGVITKANVY